MGAGGYFFWLGASADADRAGVPSGLSQSSLSQAKPLIPCAVAERFWAACLKHEKTITIPAALDMLKALGLRLTIVPKDAK
jgi:hypothetical protein